MLATIMYGAGDVRVESVPDPSIIEPTDAVIRVVRACICGRPDGYRAMNERKSIKGMVRAPDN